MSDQQQPGQQPGVGATPPPQQWGTPQSAPTEYLGTEQPPPGGGGEPVPQAADGSGGGGRRRGLVIGAVVVVVLLIGGGSFAAYTMLSGGGPQPAEAIPDSAIAYARVDLDPSADQKINALRLLRDVPEFEEETGITTDTADLRKRFFEESLADSEGCGDIDYDDDIEPWIGDRAGVAAMPGAEGEDPQPLLVLQVTDEDAAKTGIEALLECGGADEATGEDKPGVAFVGDYALIAADDKVGDYASDAEESPLSDDEDFSGDMDALEGEGLMSFWVDMDEVVTLAQQDNPEMGDVLDAAGISELGSISAAVRAQSDALELVVAGDSDVLNLGGQSTEPASDVLTLPDTTMMAFGFTGGGETIDRLWDKALALEESGEAGVPPGSMEEFSAQLEAETGFTMPDDLSVLLGEQFTLAVDGEGFDFVSDEGTPDFSTINVGARLRTDTSAASDLMDTVQDLLAQQGAPFEIAQQETDGGLVIAANEDYADSLADEGQLGDSDVFDSAVADSDDAVSIFFLDLNKVGDVADRLAEDAGEDLPPEAGDTLDVLQAVGASTTIDDDYARTTFRLVFD